MEYRVEYEYLGFLDKTEFGRDYRRACDKARRASKRHTDIAYVVALDDGEPVGHIGYANGVRDSIDGQIR